MIGDNFVMFKENIPLCKSEQKEMKWSELSYPFFIFAVDLRKRTISSSEENFYHIQSLYKLVE